MTKKLDSLLILLPWLFLSSCLVNGQRSINTNKNQLGVSPIIPVGLDSYLMWDKWPLQRIGVRAYMRSTYDRRGGNEGPGDSRHFLFANEEDYNVTLDVKGKGSSVFF